MKIPTLTAVALAAIVTLTGCGGDEGMSASEQRQALRDENPHLHRDSHYAPDEVPEISQEDRDALADAHGSYHDGGYEAPISEEEIESDEISDDELSSLALQLVWDSQSASSQEDFCWGWDYDRDMMVDAFLEGAENSFSRSEVISFYNGVC